MMNVNNKCRRRWPWVLLGVIVGAPAVLVLVLQITFSANKLRPDQLEPPSGLSAGSHAKPAGKPPRKLEDCLSSAEAADIYTKWAAKFTNEKEWLEHGPTGRRAGEPLTADQVKWLLENRELIDDLMRLAKTKPAIESHDQLAPGDLALIKLMEKEFIIFQGFSRILSAEGRRRRDAGDFTGAAEALLAINPLAKSVSEPTLLGELVAIAMQAHSSLELADWLHDPSMTPEFAKLLRARFGESAVGAADFRRYLERDYAFKRDETVRLLSGSLANLIQYHTDLVLNLKEPVPALKKGLLDHFYERPGQTTLKVAWGTWQAVVAKSRAASLVDHMDASYGGMLSAIDTNRNLPEIDFKNMPYFERIALPNYQEALTRTDVSAANVNLGVAGLDAVLGNQTTATDPFANEPLKTVQADDEITIYSVGPDRTDQRASVRYDPTNGTLSAGDIWVRVRKTR